MPSYSLRCDEIRGEGDELIFEHDAATPIHLCGRCLESVQRLDDRLTLRRGQTTIVARATRIADVARLGELGGSVDHPSALVRVGDDAVSIVGHHIYVGIVCLDLKDVSEFAERGANVALPSAYPTTPYRLLPAALAMLVVEAPKRPPTPVT